ncbi:DUF393 domain-containing protein [Bacillus mycoides]|uniref:DUF393 domain-containing protein n=1 Tax=Bacillus thuringiensis serovar navarrensis TaxID=339658 RepID=A0A243AJD8_BACTU|nr:MULTISPECIES: DUF393 domain-containing protein [Bacillus cereus group]MED1270810.1 DUF393 domain-containing protein [Bacillus mycoides]OFD35967.1 hypothetical protein BWGOE3_57360 [Bacillus mycoides]OFD36147.1 hypothetical protein BWGOE1_56330 [Bacillus mycoides]OFD36198.1 hypothetical protein BWGOE2_55360 [Bacillus mycoides]OFD53014.1 hypothetical protein BWGOE4_55150 [Bacillus mycoides]
MKNLQTIQKKLLPKNHITIYFDGYCVFCNKIVDSWKQKDYYDLLHFKSFREKKHQMEINIDIKELNKYIHATNSQSGHIYKGIDVVIEVSKRIPKYWALLPILYVSKFTKIGNFVYSIIAKNRKIVPVNKCTDESCSIDIYSHNK